MRGEGGLGAEMVLERLPAAFIRLPLAVLIFSRVSVEFHLSDLSFWIGVAFS